MAAGLVAWGLMSPWTVLATQQPAEVQAHTIDNSGQSTEVNHNERMVIPPVNLLCKVRRIQQVQEEDYQDLRQPYPPKDRDILEAAYVQMIHRPTITTNSTTLQILP